MLTRVGVPLAGLVVVVSACTSSSGSADNPRVSAPAGAANSTGVSQPAPTASSSSSTPPAVALAVTPKARTGLNPSTPITVTVKNGTLNSVKLVNPDGKTVQGALSADKTSWHSSEDLGYSKTYRLTARATDSSGEGARVLTRKFTTLTPDNMTMPYLDDIYGSPLQRGATYGIGMIPVVHFDEAISDKKAAEKALSVTTSPHVDGSWYWATDSDVHWRPRNFYQPGTKITVTAKVYGVNVGNGMYGQADQSVSYRIGAKHVAIADAATHKVKVYFNGKLMRTMPTSMGRGGSVEGKNGPIYLWTMPGTYTVLGHENPATMSSDSYGLSADSPLGYGPEKVPYATKISVDGIYLHELDTTVWAQGNMNVSHGCLNLNYDNAKWYYNTSRVGDIVRVVHSGGPKLQEWQGGDWTLSWAEWKKGSAL